MTNKLFYGDNLDVLREHIASESVDLIYLDPPFNSNATFCGFEVDDEDDPYVRQIGVETDTLLAKLKRIDPFEFENVCKRVLDKLGGNSQVTQKSRDGGIDFFSVGIDILPEGINAPAQCRATVIGQAKRFSDRLIAEKALREFVGATVLKRNELRIAKSVSPLSPIMLAFWTTSDFDPNCKKFARDAGVWVMDGRTLSAYLHRLELSDWVLSLPDHPASSSNSSIGN